MKEKIESLTTEHVIDFLSREGIKITGIAKESGIPHVTLKKIYNGTIKRITKRMEARLLPWMITYGFNINNLKRNIK